MRIRQSDLSAYSRCPQQKRLSDLQKGGLLDKAPEQLSRTAFGSVMHHAVHVMEKAFVHGTGDPLEQALATFRYYWEPANIGGICPPVTIWCARDTWSGMARMGEATLRAYWDRLQKDVSKVLGLEVSFTLPYEIDGVEHELHGTIDRLSLRKSSATFLNVEDFKTGLDYVGLRWNNQFTVYSYATTRPEFWEQWGEPGLHERFRLLPRRGTWISLRNGAKRSDAGYRGADDFARMHIALREYVRANDLGSFPLSLTGAVCQYCPFREGICGGIPVPDENYGKAGLR